MLRAIIVDDEILVRATLEKMVDWGGRGFQLAAATPMDRPRWRLWSGVRRTLCSQISKCPSAAGWNSSTACMPWALRPTS